MKVEVCHPGELGEPELARWRAIQRADDALASPFFSPEFTVAVGALRPRARVAVLRDGADIVGFFPFQRSGLAYGAPIAGRWNNAQGVVAAAGLEWDPRELLRACGLAAWEFDHLAEGQEPFGRYETARVPAPAMDLSNGIDPFMQNLRSHKSRFGELSRLRRKLAREIGQESFVVDSQDHQALRTVMKWKSAQCLRNGWADCFAPARNAELLELLLDTRTESFSGLLSMLYVDDVPLAGHFGLRSERVVVDWFPSYDPAFGAYAPGLIMHLALAQASCDIGIARVEMGPGDEAFKTWFGNRKLSVGRGRAVRPSARGGLHWITRASIDRIHHTILSHPSVHQPAKRVRARYVRTEAALRRRGSARSAGKTLKTAGRR